VSERVTFQLYHGWNKLVNFQRDDGEVRFILDQHP